MLTGSSVDHIFENVWKEFTERRETDRQYLALLYLDALLKEAGLRTDRALPKMEAFIEAARVQLGENAVEVTPIGFVVVLPDQNFSLTAKHDYCFLLNSMSCFFSTDVTVMEPRQAALLMDAAGHYMTKAGKRWDAYIKQREEEERLREIEWRYRERKNDLLDRFAKALIDAKETDGLVEEYRNMLQAQAEEKGSPLPASEIKNRIASFLDEGQKAEKLLIKRREAAEKARVKRLGEKQADEERYQRELRHLVETMGMEPRITRRIPWTGKHFLEYTFPLSNGQTISIKDSFKNPARVEEFASTVMRELQMMLPYLSSKVRIATERWPSSKAMLRYYREAALKGLPADSPFKSLVLDTDIPQNTVSFHVNQRSFVCHYYFKQGDRRCLRLSLPHTLSAEQIKEFIQHYKALIRYDKSMRRWRTPLDYGFDVPEKE